MQAHKKCRYIFHPLSHIRFLVRVSYLEIYNEEVRDLLGSDQTGRLEVKERPDTGVYVKDLSAFSVHNADDMDRIMNVGNKNSEYTSALPFTTGAVVDVCQRDLQPVIILRRVQIYSHRHITIFNVLLKVFRYDRKSLFLKNNRCISNWSCLYLTK